LVGTGGEKRRWKGKTETAKKERTAGKKKTREEKIKSTRLIEIRPVFGKTLRPQRRQKRSGKRISPKGRGGRCFI